MRTNTISLYNELKKKGEADCPNCKKGKIKAKYKNTPYFFVCDNCKISMHVCPGEKI